MYRGIPNFYRAFFDEPEDFSSSAIERRRLIKSWFLYCAQAGLPLYVPEGPLRDADETSISFRAQTLKARGLFSTPHRLEGTGTPIAGETESMFVGNTAQLLSNGFISDFVNNIAPGRLGCHDGGAAFRENYAPKILELFSAMLSGNREDPAWLHVTPTRKRFQKRFVLLANANPKQLRPRIDGELGDHPVRDLVFSRPGTKARVSLEDIRWGYRLDEKDFVPPVSVFVPRRIRFGFGMCRFEEKWVFPATESDRDVVAAGKIPSVQERWGTTAQPTAILTCVRTYKSKAGQQACVLAIEVAKRSGEILSMRSFKTSLRDNYLMSPAAAATIDDALRKR